MHKLFDPAKKENIELIKAICSTGQDNPHDEELRIMRVIDQFKGHPVNDNYMSTQFGAQGTRVSLYIATIDELANRGVIVKMEADKTMFYMIDRDFKIALITYKKNQSQ